MLKPQALMVYAISATGMLFGMARKTQKKNAAAVALGRKGGKKRVPKGFSMLNDSERRRIAQEAAAARWGKKTA